MQAALPPSSSATSSAARAGDPPEPRQASGFVGLQNQCVPDMTYAYDKILHTHMGSID